MRLTYWSGPIDNLGGLFRTMGVALLDDDICRDVRQFIRRTRLRRENENAERVIVSLLWSPRQGVDTRASLIRYI